jgi:predicted alpha-1,2-mannosidase
MRSRTWWWAIALVTSTVAVVAAVSPAVAAPQKDYVGLVNPWVEADRGRFFFFQSASTPFGFVKLRPDTSTQTQWGSGYLAREHEVKGFSHVHDWQLAGVQVMPTSGASVPKTNGDTGWQSHVEHDDSELAEPGYHRLHLDRYGIKAELTSTDRVGVHRYTFENAGRAEIIVNLGGTLGEAVMKDAHVTRVGNREITGYVDQRGADPIIRSEVNNRLYFDVRFDKPFDSLQGWKDGKEAGPVDALDGKDAGVFARYEHLAAGEVVQMKVGLSLTGTDGARRNLEAEAPGWDFDAIRRAAQARWNDMLGRVDVSGGTHEQQVKFYTDLFHVLCGRSTVSDADGRYLDNTWGHGMVKRLPLDRSGRPQFAMYNYDALWLTQWNLNTMLGLAYPDVYSSFVKSQLQMYEDGGLLPRGPVAGNDSLIMTGAPVTSFIAGAWNKGIRDFDIDTAYDAMLDAQSVGGLFDKAGWEYTTWSGDGGIRPYLDLGYVPHDIEGPGGLLDGAGLTLEYAFQDWTLGQLAKDLHKRGINIAQYARADASSQAGAGAGAAARAIDGRPIRSGIGGPGDVEWISNERTPWIRLTWDQPQQIHRVVLRDRADGASNATSGLLRFSDGSTKKVKGIPADGSPKTVDVGGRRVSWVRFEATGGKGSDVGLDEFEAWDRGDAAAYLDHRSRNWRNVFDASTGFIRPKGSDGTWLPGFDPLSPTDFVESNSWQATWFTPQDVMGLANLMGGRKAYADKLDYAFTNSEPFDFIGDYGQGFVSYGNQPGLEMAHLFNYVGYPWLTQHWVREVQEQTYGSTSTTDGYGHHDEDEGQMGSMSALMAMGLFEVTGGGLGDPVYDITSPVFDQVRIKLDRRYYRGGEFRIVTHGSSKANQYIQRARLDGRELRDAWFRHSQLADGGTLELWLGDTPNKAWGVDHLPPSQSPEQAPVYATGVTIEGPDRIAEPYGTTRYSAELAPADTSYRKVRWSVTDPDGSPTDKATIDDQGVMTVDDRDGQVVITAVAADDHAARAQRTVTIALDPALLRGNAARWPGVTVRASSEYNGGYAATKAIDGVIGLQDSGDWASAGEQNPWIELHFKQPIRADRIVLYDRSGTDDVNDATLRFSDGSTIDVTGIPPGRDAATVRFPMRTFDSVRLQVTGGTGPNVGLSEFEVYAVTAAPEAPSEAYAREDDGAATVAWKPPAFDGGAPITGYTVVAYEDGAPVKTVETGDRTTHAVLPGLAPGRAHRFTVAAHNLSGTSAEATARDASLLRDNAARWPGASATASSEYDGGYTAAKVRDGGPAEWASAGEQNPWIELRWTKPVEADAIVLRDRPGVDEANGGTLTFSDGSTVEVTGIRGEPKRVTFPRRTLDRVRFQVEGGDGPNVGLAELEVLAVPSAPGAPTGVDATAGTGTATVMWAAPAFDGGAAVTEYVVTPYRDGSAQAPVIVGSEQIRAQVTSLASGASYRFTVAARNLLGTGAESEPSQTVVAR